jgi:superfamily I DNA and/or RNA helicase
LQNPAEADVCLEIAKLLRGKEFKIITPYNGQTTMIDKKLKEAQDLPKEEREDKCNNVDSFQGENESNISPYSSPD